VAALALLLFEREQEFTKRRHQSGSVAVVFAKDTKSEMNGIARGLPITRKRGAAAADLCRLRDISQGDCGLVLQHRCRPGTALIIDLREHEGNTRRSIRARVVHATPFPVDGMALWLLGCRFDEPLSEAELAALQWPFVTSRLLLLAELRRRYWSAWRRRRR
jgi:hypothetical protein